MLRSETHFTASSENILKHSGVISSLMQGSTICLSTPVSWQDSAQSRKLTCSSGSSVFITGRAHRISNNTTPKEYTSDFLVRRRSKNYSGSKYPKDPFTAVLTCALSLSVHALDRPKSETLAINLSSSRMLVVLTSRWMIPCSVPVWR